MDLGLKGKTIMVAAGSRGLGLGIARQVAKEGARVSIAAPTEPRVHESAAKLRDETGASVISAVMDARDHGSILKWRDDTLDAFESIDGLVVNAGGPPAGLFDDFDDADWASAFELTLLSAVRMIRAVLPSMRAGQSGSIVTVTSSSVKEPIDYEDAVRLVLDIGAQLEVAEKNGKGFININMNDIKRTGEGSFLLISKDVYDIRNKQLWITKPIKYNSEMAPELALITQLPAYVNINVSYYSLCKTILNSLDINKNIERLRPTKLYWLIKRATHKEPNNRRFLYI